MRRHSRWATILVAAAAAMAAGCSLFSEQVVLEGAVAQVEADRIYIAAAAPLQGEVGLKVTVYQRIEQPAVDPTDPPWHLLKPVATGEVVEVTPQGAWVRITGGAIEPRGEIQLRHGGA